MNKIDLFKYPRFPLSSETLDFMQQMAVLTAKLAGLGGINYILNGCVETGSSVAAGVIVINGEILPFIGGTKTTYVVIEETNRSVTAESQLYADIYTSRVCRFGTGTVQIEWSTIKRVPDLLTVSAGLAELAEAFDKHILDHRVGWANIDDKPLVFPTAILKVGTFYVNDFATDKLETITFPTIGTSDYIVSGSLRGVSANWDADNDIIWMVRSLTDTSFSLCLREVSANVQSCYFDYALIKR